MFDYTEKDIGWLEECLSAERLKPYLVKARGNVWVAYHLYERNIALRYSLLFSEFAGSTRRLNSRYAHAASRASSARESLSPDDRRPGRRCTDVRSIQFPAL